jgi:hypothetical protein
MDRPTPLSRQRQASQSALPSQEQTLTQILPLRHWTLALCLACAALSGCSNLGVQPWERDLLAKPSMQLASSPVESSIDEHIYFSKEAATGGRSTGGGGCGCN